MTTKAHKEAMELFEEQYFVCQYCNTQFSPEQPPLHVHHRVFKQMGKTDKRFETKENKAVCCWKCHHDHGKLKGAKLYHEKDFSIIEELTERLLNG